MATTATKRSSGCFRGYTNEQKTLRAKLDQLIKWTRDLKSNLMKQSIKVLQTNNNNRQTIDQIHDDLDEYKRKLDRELGRIHDICDALGNNLSNGNEENLRDEILEALRRSPTYSSLEQHMYDDQGPRIRVKPRERTHPGQNQRPRTQHLSADTIKRKATQPVAVDTSHISNTKRRSGVDAFKRSRSFTNVEHTETPLGMDYIEEDEDDLAWKPFGPKKSISHISPINNEQSNDEQPSASPIVTNQTEKPKPSAPVDDNSSDEEFDVAWERRAKQKARKEAASAPPPSSSVESSSKRNVRFSPSTNEQVDLIELDFDETTQDGLQQIKDQNNNHNKQQTEVVNVDDDDETIMSATDTQSQITTGNTQDDDSQIIEDSDDDDEIIALSDDEIPTKSSISFKKKSTWTSSEIQISSGNSQSQSLYNPYRVGIADPSLRSIFLPPPSSQPTTGSVSGNKRNQAANRKASPAKRGANAKNNNT